VVSSSKFRRLETASRVIDSILCHRCNAGITTT
jgi:hypothetical protein